MTNYVDLMRKLEQLIHPYVSVVSRVALSMKDFTRQQLFQNLTFFEYYLVATGSTQPLIH